MKGKIKKVGKPLGATFGLLGAMAAIWWFAFKPRKSKKASSQDSD
jgi:hypothetical protein